MKLNYFYSPTYVYKLFGHLESKQHKIRFKLHNVLSHSIGNFWVLGSRLEANLISSFQGSYIKEYIYSCKILKVKYVCTRVCKCVHPSDQTL